MRSGAALLLAAALWLGCLWAGSAPLAALSLVVMALAVWPASRERPRAALALTPFGSWMVVRVSRIAGTRTSARVLLQLDRGEGPGDGGVDVAVGQPVATTVRVTPPPDGAFGRYLEGLGVVAAVRPIGPVRSASAPAPIAATTAVRERAT